MEWITLIGAVIAALAASYNIWLTYSNGRDSILVKCGFHMPTSSPATALHVVNTGKHTVKLYDYGFIEESGLLFSIPFDIGMDPWSHEADDYKYRYGTMTIQPHDLFCEGITFNPEIVGVYAMTVSQAIPRVKMIRSRLRPTVLWAYLKAKFRPRHA